MYRHLIPLLLYCLFALPNNLLSQDGQDTRPIIFQGKVMGSDTLNETYSVMIINKRNGQGVFGHYSGKFSINGYKSDCFIVSSTGYKTFEICFGDSVYKSIYDCAISLPKLEYDLRALEVFPVREINQIYKEIDRLGYSKKDYMLSGVDVFNSPITFLYQRFSRREQQKRRAYEIINYDRKRDLLKELLTRYVHADIIDLENNKFDEFIDFCNPSDSLIQNSSQYDFIMYVKGCYKAYMDTYGW